MTMQDLVYEQQAVTRLCTCGRSATGFCSGLHRLSNQEWDHMFADHVTIAPQDLPPDSGSHT